MSSIRNTWTYKNCFCHFEFLLLLRLMVYDVMVVLSLLHLFLLLMVIIHFSLWILIHYVLSHEILFPNFLLYILYYKFLLNIWLSLISLLISYLLDNSTKLKFGLVDYLIYYLLLIVILHHLMVKHRIYSLFIC